MGVVPPEPGFNAFLAETCAPARRAVRQRRGDDRASAPAGTGQWGLDGAAEGWRPDLMTFGKVMGGGFPAAAFGGRADVMARLAPEGPVYQAGTLSGNPVATTAGLTTLRLATDEVYDHLTAAGETIKAAASRGARPRPVSRTSSSRPARCSGCSSPTATGPRLRGRLAARTGRLRGVLPRHAGPGRLPAAVGVRGVVPVLRPRRPRGPDRARRPARRGRAPPRPPDAPQPDRRPA